MKLLGFVKYRDVKTGEAKFLVTVGKDCSQFDNSNGRFGMNVAKEYLPWSAASNVNPEDIGRECSFKTDFNSTGQIEKVGLIFE